MIIEDEELRSIFKTASEERLQKLDNGLLYLEKHSEDKAKLEELMREAHSLKGDAGMLGIKDVATLAHQMEHILGTLKRSETELSATISDRLYHGLDAIRQLVEEAVTGNPPRINTFHVLAYMMGANTSPSPTNTEAEEAIEQGSRGEFLDSLPVPSHQSPITNNTDDAQSKDALASPRAIVSHPGTELLPIPVKANEHTDKQESILTSTPTPATIQLKNAAQTKTAPEQPYPKDGGTSRFAIESVRVETRHLDSLMTQAGELTVTKIRINHRLAEIEEIVNLWDELSRQRAQWSAKTLFSSRVFNGESVRWGESEQFPPAPLYSALRKDSQQTIEHFFEQLGTLVNHLRNSLYEDTQRLEAIADELSDGIRTMRLLPLSTIFNLFPRMVRDLAKQQGKEIELVIEGGETKADKRILEEMKDPLMHMIRNCIDHGIETPEERMRLGKSPQAKILLKAKQTTTNVVIEVSDDGRGLDIEKIKQTAIKRRICGEEELAIMTPGQIQSLIFTPGFSTRTFVTEVSGRGVGLDVVRTNVENLKGTLQVESTPNQGCTIRMSLPTTLATAHVLIVAVDGISYAIPVEYVQMARLVAQDDIFPIKGQDTILLDSQPISVVPLADLLELPTGKPGSQGAGVLLSRGAIEPGSGGAGEQRTIPYTPSLQPHTLFFPVTSPQSPVVGAGLPRPYQSPVPCIILKVGDASLGLLVDALLDEQDVMLKPQSQLLKRVRNVSGATILGSGEVCMVLNPQDLIKSVRKQALSGRREKHSLTSSVANLAKQAILLVEDSIAIRTQEKRILEGAGYEVVTAVDGLDALNKLKTRSFDAVVSDIQMPNLDGLALTAKIRQHKEYTELPVILVTSLASDEDKRRGAEVGASAYITKGTFNQEVLLDTLKRLV